MAWEVTDVRYQATLRAASVEGGVRECTCKETGWNIAGWRWFGVGHDGSAKQLLLIEVVTSTRQSSMTVAMMQPDFQPIS